MGSRSAGDRTRNTFSALGDASRAALRFFKGSAVSRVLTGAPRANHLLLVPQDMRTADPSFAGELYDGYFGLAGTVALIGSESPFSVLPPSPLWQRELYTLSWLNNLEAAADEIAREKARHLVADWIRHAPDAPDIAWDVDIVGRRVISLLSHAGFLLEGAKTAFYDQVMSQLSRELHSLTANYTEAGHSAPKLRALIALLMAGLCIAELKNYVSSYLSVFVHELDKQILRDGGHVSRNPGILVDLLLDMLPLKQCFLARTRETPEGVNAAINRMMGMIRFLRLGDGSLARFNGMGATRSDLTAAVLAYSDNNDMPQLQASDSGYCRLERGSVVLISDVGPPPPLAVSTAAHAGFLGFELTSGIEPIIINCGAARDETTEWGVACRSSAAHSTLTISDVSSSRLAKRKLPYPAYEVHVLNGPRIVRGEVKEDQGDLMLRAVHDGYKDRYGLLHQRRLRLVGNGGLIEGVDQLTCPPNVRMQVKDTDFFAIHFHLHPRVSPRLDGEENSVSLTLPDAQLWKFRAAGAKVEIEESIFLADPIIQKRSLQIVLRGPCAAEAQIVWSLRKIETNIRDSSRTGYRGNREIEHNG
ncbi:MAG: heparinase II/III family protein [Alphaproteobacteria bacterium]